jgi:two-component system sensor kinase FixL
MEQPQTDGWTLADTLAKLAELVPVGIVRTDRGGNCVYANQRWYQLTGLTRKAALGDGWLQALHPEDRQRVLRQWRQPAAEAKEFADEFRIQGPDGLVRVVSSRILPLFDVSGQMAGYLGAFTDITEREQSEQALRRLAHDLRERVKELNCLFAISHLVESAGGSLPYILQETAKLLPPSWEYPEHTCARILLDGGEYRTENYRETPWRQAADIMVHGERAGLVEVAYLQEMPRRDEGPFLAEERRLITEVAKRLGRIAERLRTEETLRAREQELRERLTHLTRVSVMGELASSIAHEVSQPLTAIATYAQACQRLLAQDATDKSEVHAVLGRISEEALRAGSILQKLRELVKKHETRWRVRDVNELVREVEHLAAVDARLHDIRLRLALSSPLPAVKVDGIQIQQVILNLVRNAIDATEDVIPEEREVLICTAARDGREVEVSVRDHGSGLPAGAEDRLFEPFFTTKPDGIGMGLSISLSIISAHGGRMWFAPTPGGGTTFFFSLPAAQGDEHVAD